MENKTKERLATEQQIIHNLIQCIELFPQYTVSQHLVHFLRKKDATKEAYNWTDEFLLKRVEKYYDELREELSNPIIDEEEY